MLKSCLLLLLFALLFTFFRFIQSNSFSKGFHYFFAYSLRDFYFEYMIGFFKEFGNLLETFILDIIVPYIIST